MPLALRKISWIKHFLGEIFPWQNILVTKFQKQENSLPIKTALGMALVEAQPGGTLSF
jgi:hypothetical protein